MAQRSTRKQLDQLAELISGALKGDLRVVVEGRYGYTAIDLYDGEGCVRTLSTGNTTGQAHQFLRGMVQTLDIVGRNAEGRS